MSQFVEIREPHTGKLLARYDPNRDLLEVQRRGQKTLVDLNALKEREKQERKQGAGQPVV
jgi:hypothetical protein